MIVDANQNGPKGPSEPESYFAPARRSGRAALRENIDLIVSNPIADALLRTVSGLMAILNEQRQILAVNASLMEVLGIDDTEAVLGLRPGEAIQCVHAQDRPGGCGTGRHCVTCGAAIAIVTALTTDKAHEETCVAEVTRKGKKTDLFFRVRCCPVLLDGTRFLLLFLQDCTVQQRQALLERMFFHDIGNTICGLRFSAQLFNREEDTAKQKEIVARIAQIARQLNREVGIQRSLARQEPDAFSTLMEEVNVSDVVGELRTMLSSQAISQDKTLVCPDPIPEITIVSDVALLKRVLVNMLINAFEATDPGGTIRLWVEQTDKEVSFGVWNRRAIPAAQQLRIFQRNYSTKSDFGRGLGTYSMKLFGETYLGGTVDFTSSEADGTTFRLRLPKAV